MAINLKDMAVNAYKETKRIIRLTRKPRPSEYNETAKITGLGVIAIGLLGFIIFVVAELTGI